MRRPRRSGETPHHPSRETPESSSRETLESSSRETLESSSRETLESSSRETLESSSRETPLLRKRGYRCPLTPILFGGGQERGLRPGTLLVPLVVGLGKAAELALADMPAGKAAEAVKVKLLADLRDVPHAINGDLSRSQPHVLNISFPGVDSEALMLALRDEMAVSNGSACTSAAYKPSHVLVAMGRDETLIRSALRISWGPKVICVSVAGLIAAVRVLRPCLFAYPGIRVQAILPAARGQVPDVV